MDIFLDAEFNGFGGRLISNGLVCADGREWYEVAEIPAEPHPENCKRRRNAFRHLAE